MKYYNEHFIKLCCQGDKISQKRLFEELYAPMFRIVQRYVNHNAEAEDCVMTGFMKVFQNIGRFRFEGDHSLFVWIRRIMVNEALMFLRRSHNFFLSLETTATDMPVQSEALSRLDAEELNTMIRSLPTGYRTVFNLYVVEGYDHKEIAGMLGISENTSRTQLAKAKNKLRIMLDEKEEPHGKLGY